jgi:hypothetical protein
MVRQKKAMAMSFSWIFAIITGGFILFLAIYSASQFIQTQERVLYTETAAQLASLLDPLETGLASGKSAEINFQKISRTYYECNERTNPPFGEQKISFTEQTFGREFGNVGELVTLKNKYVFSEDVVEGRSLYMFSVPFFMPFKIADIIVVSSEDYCFYDAPNEIMDEMEGLNIKNVFFPNASATCEGISVCFDSGQDCDITVNTREKYVLKEGNRHYYTDTLVYGAIFSSPAVYECNVKRLKAKFDELALIYIGKIQIIERKGCESQVQGKLNSMIGKIEASGDLLKLYEDSLVVDSLNEGAKSGCKLY